MNDDRVLNSVRLRIDELEAQEKLDGKEFGEYLSLVGQALVIFSDSNPFLDKTDISTWLLTLLEMRVFSND